MGHFKVWVKEQKNNTFKDQNRFNPVELMKILSLSGNFYSMKVMEFISRENNLWLKS